MKEQIKGQLTHFPAGAILIHEGEHSRQMFIIQTGKARVFKEYLNHKVTLSILGAGEIFGELSFFDAEPRTASVEALTELSVLMIDGNAASKQIQNLPPWVEPIFRSVFQRFRSADHKIAVLQSMYEFQKRGFSRDTVAQTIYTELLRFMRTFDIIYQREKSAKGMVSSKDFQLELDEILGRRYLALKVFIRLLKESDFMDHLKEEKEGLIEVREQAFQKFRDYLIQQVQSEKFLLLGHPAIAILRKILGLLGSVKTNSENLDHQKVEISIEELKLDAMPLYKEGLRELEKEGTLTVHKQKITLDPLPIYQIYTYQSFLKSFDHTHMNLE